ncbi:hypothetical protein MMC25_000155 [Agyrium rufum]|nr:hypothetical protein [Agyrium rufum]
MALTKSPNDYNTYVLGSISGHNIALAPLPTGAYGTTSATAAATRMHAAFGSITTWLLVGIGGGVPSAKHDIRLGDVVVSTDVKPYRNGKAIGEDKFERTGTLSKPHILLLNAVSMLRANHDSPGSRISSILHDTFAKHPSLAVSYAHPGQHRDILIESECCHVADGDVCSECGPRMPIKRPSREDNDPKIHYGSIASGDQVMKHGKTRDRLGKELGVLCFEMEAAGLMDNFPCLVIRGICDYCDAEKQEHFQNYAALTAAAYAREILTVIPARNGTRPADPASPQSNMDLEHRRLLMDSLDFDKAKARHTTIKRAHARTCKWLLDHPEYLAWLDETHLPANQGFLWIKGKPGTRKSTIMKYILANVGKTLSRGPVLISFFFNARGENLEKSTVGMFRSILHQLFSKLPYLQNLLESLKAPSSHN